MAPSRNRTRRSEQQQEGGSAIDTPSVAPRARILLVDDDERNLLALSEVLEDIADIVRASSGEEALRHLLKQRFAVIILDVLMPGMDGYETARLIRAREQSRGTPIIFLTAINKEDAHLLRGYDLGAVDYVFKPFEPTIVRSKVQVFVSLHEKTLEIEHKALVEQRLLNEKLEAQRERMEAVEALRESEARQALIVNALPIAAYVREPVGGPRFVAGNIAAITGFDAAAFEADPGLWISRIHPDDRLARTDDGRGAQYRWRHADGEYRYLLDQWVPLPERDGVVAGTLRDVTEQRLIQDQLLQAQKMDAVGKLTGGIAHDFNNLLASVLSGLALIERRGGLNDRAADVLEMTRHAAEQGKHLVSRLLAFSRRQNLAPEVVHLDGLGESVRGMLAPVLGGLTTLKLEAEQGLWPTFIDASQLELAIMNLAINARDAMPNGGTIVIRFANRSTEATEDLPAGDYVVVTVSDAGVGIPAQLLSKVIEPFFTTKDVGKGTGLGLSTAYGFAKQSGGTLRISSSVNKGTSVEMWLPRARPALEPARAAAPGTPSPPVQRCNKAHVLLVDDSESLRTLTAQQLAEEGFQVTVASGGAEALALIERDQQGFDVIVTDFAMPLMSGLDVIRMARTVRADWPAVIITGYAEISAISERPGDVPLVLKPFTTGDLLDAIDRSMAGTVVADELPSPA